VTEMPRLPFSEKQPVPDAAEREQALNVYASWIVEAPAGSGKTGLLLQRYLKLLADKGVEDPEEVLVMTFTVKATAELRDRVLRQLENAQRQTKVDDDDFAHAVRALAEAVLRRSAEMGWDLPTQSQRLNIRSIDSLCAEIASMLPLLSGSGGRQRPVLLPQPMYQEAARRTLMQLGSKDVGLQDALQILMQHRDANLDNCQNLIANMLEWREQWARLVPLQEMEDAELEKARPRLEDAMIYLARELGEAAPTGGYPEEQWKVAKALFRLLRQALAELKVLFAEREECDFTELSLAARQALDHENGADEYAASLGMKLKHLLVDEMQDTSLGQYELIERLTRGWDGHSQTVFLVGDPKQSIYLFRQARVERFLRTMEEERLGDIPLGALRLRANFRSQGGLVQQFNDDFGKLFPPEIGATLGGDVPFVSASAVREANASQGRVWHTHPLPNNTARGGREARRYVRQQAEADAQEICELIMKWRTRKLPSERDDPDSKKQKPWKIAVLVLARTHLPKIVAEMKRSGIPFRAVDIDELGGRREVQDLLALTRALLHPLDRSAWFAVLRAPWCGLTLTDLHRLAGGDDSAWRNCNVERLIAERGGLLSPEGRQRLEKTWAALQTALAQRGRMTMAQWLERTWRSLGGDAYSNDEEMENVHNYLRLLDDVERETGRMDLAALMQKMEKLFASPGCAENAVDLMTIHGAKGLEWDVVIVPGLERQPGQADDQLLSWLEVDAGEDQSHVLLAPIHESGKKKAELNKWLKQVQTEREAAERKRLLYVACTRAREELHLFAAPKRTKQGEISRHPQSLLAAAWPAAQSFFTAEVIPFPASQPRPGVIDIAAETETVVRRIPQRFDALARFQTTRRLWAPKDAVAPGAFFERPEGSFAAREFGNAVHAFLEVLAERIAGGAEAESLLREVAGWKQRVEAVVRGMGVAPGDVKEIAAATLRGLENTLHDETGRWVLAAHAEARSEQTLELEERTLRLDRSFFAGAEPMTTGESHLWIVDFKTSEPGRRDPETFFTEEKETYRPQMEAYAAAFGGDGKPMRLALYYPLEQRLIWWGYAD